VPRTQGRPRRGQHKHGPELVTALLASARIGAVHSVIFGGGVANAIADRGKNGGPSIAGWLLLPCWHDVPLPLSTMNALSLPANPSWLRLPSLRRLLIGLALIGSFLSQFSVAWMLRNQIAIGFSDFSAFYMGGKIVASGNGGNLYDLVTQARVEGAYTVRSDTASFLPYNHAPFEAVLLAPLAVFPYPTACWIWWVCNLLLGFLVLFLLRPQLPRLNTWLALAILGMGFFQPLLTAECQGQDSVLSLLLFTVCFVNLVRGQAWIAGSALAFTIYKPQLALAMIAILAITSEKRWRILAGFIETCLGLAALSIAMLGWRACAAYPAFVERFAADFDDVKSRTETMPNLRGLMYPIFGTHLSHPVFVLLVGAVSVLFVLAALWASRGKCGTVQGKHLQFALAVTVTEIVAYHGFLHDMTVLLLPLFLVWNSLAETGLTTWRRRVLAAIVLLLFCRVFLPASSLPFYACASIALFALLCLEIRGSGEPAVETV